MNLHDLFAIPLRRTPHKLAIHYLSGDGHQDLTYQELFDAVDRLASGLQSWGLRKGDRVAFYLGNCPEFVVAYLAVVRLGAVMVPINLHYRRLEIAHILGDCAPTLLVSSQEYLPILHDAGWRDHQVRDILVIEEMNRWRDEPVHLDLQSVLADDLSQIMYTSGTTGRSKGAMLTHNNVIATVTALLSAWAWQPDDDLLLCLPLFHIHGLVVGLHCALAAGATVSLRAKFDLQMTVTDLLSGTPTLFFAVPTIYVRLVDALKQVPLRDFGRMRLFCSGSAPLAAETFSAFRELTGHTILERYGMTETGMNLSNLYAGPRMPGSVGTPLPGVFMRIVGETGRDLPPGEEGELLVSGSNVFSGYWNAAEKTLASFSHDEMGQRWFHTGDLARQDPQSGYVTLLGRRHELIISGGFNIYPREIEEMLVLYPGIVEAAVVGMPHEEWGEVPIAYVVCEETIDDQELTRHCRSQLAGFKIPRQFIQVSSLPRNAMGKLQKHRLPVGEPRP